MRDPVHDLHICGRIRRVKGGFIVEGVNPMLGAGDTHVLVSFEDLVNLLFRQAATHPDDWRPGERVSVTLPATQREKT